MLHDHNTRHMPNVVRPLPLITVQDLILPDLLLHYRFGTQIFLEFLQSTHIKSFEDYTSLVDVMAEVVIEAPVKDEVKTGQPQLASTSENVSSGDTEPQEKSENQNVTNVGDRENMMRAMRQSAYNPNLYKWQD